MAERFGPFELLELLGSGGMAEVRRAIYRGESGFTKPMAVKRMLPHKLADADARTGFEDEARLCSRLHHPKIVEVYDFGRIEDVPYLSMELVKGWSLQRILAHGQAHGVGLGVEAAVEIGAQVCAGLAYAHGARDEQGRPLGVIHRDLKPGNLMVTEDGDVKVMDFGVAKAATNVFATQSDATRGTPCYMSPEMCEGRSVDLRSDLFGLATILAEVVLGYPIFLAETEYRSMYRIAQGDVGQAVERLDAVDGPLASVLAIAFSVEPARRFEDATSMGDALVRAAGRRPGSDALMAAVHPMLRMSPDDGGDDPSAGVEIGPDRSGDRADGSPSPTEAAELPASADAREGGGISRTLAWTAAAMGLVAILFLGSAAWRALDDRGQGRTLDGMPGALAEESPTAVPAPVDTAGAPDDREVPTGAPEPPTAEPVAAGGEPATAEPSTPPPHTGEPVTQETPGEPPDGDVAAATQPPPEGGMTEPLFALSEPDPDAVQDAVARDPALQECFRAHADGAGEVRVRFAMGADGAVSTLRIDHPQPADVPLATCVVDRLREMRFDRSGFDWTGQLTLRPPPDLDLALPDPLPR